VDLGLRFAFINHLDDPKGNTYSMGLDPSVIWRGISTNVAADSLVVYKTLRGNVRWRYGGSLGLWIKLRNVTANADMLYLRKQHSQPVDGLTGFQPLVRLGYSSWLFSF
jgi:hypothetical protein